MRRLSTGVTPAAIYLWRVRAFPQLAPRPGPSLHEILPDDPLDHPDETRRILEQLRRS